jgi:hypothetical protein
MNYYVYEITNKINNKKYIGKRCCKCPIDEDKYMGSGVLIKRAIKKYGIENFSKKILFVLNSEDEAYQKEFETIESVKAYKNPMYYNLTAGGYGVGSGISCPNYGKRPWNYGKKNIYSEEILKKLKGPRLNIRGKNNFRYGKHLSEETKMKISKSKIGKFSEFDNPNSKLSKEEVAKIKQYILKGIKFKEIANRFNISEVTVSRISSEKIYKNIIVDGFNRKNIENIMSKRQKTMLNRHIVNLNTGLEFSSIKDAGKWIGLKSASCISHCCKGRRKSAGKINGQPARWMYLDDYLKDVVNKKVLRN